MEWPTISWLEAEESRIELEKAAMALWAPEMEWLSERPAGGWVGPAPEWPFDRSRPSGLDRLLDGRRLSLRVEYRESFPMAEPVLWPLDPVPPIERRILHRWHLNGNGSLCLLQRATDWTGRDTAADLVVKAAGWFIEYLLVDEGICAAMTEHGMHSDASLDPLLDTYRQ